MGWTGCRGSQLHRCTSPLDWTISKGKKKRKKRKRKGSHRRDDDITKWKHQRDVENITKEQKNETWEKYSTKKNAKPEKPKPRQRQNETLPREGAATWHGWPRRNATLLCHEAIAYLTSYFLILFSSFLSAVVQ